MRPGRPLEQSLVAEGAHERPEEMPDVTTVLEAIVWVAYVATVLTHRRANARAVSITSQ